MPKRFAVISRSTLIAAILLFFTGAATGAAITIWRAEPAASDESPEERKIPERRRIFPRPVDVA